MHDHPFEAFKQKKLQRKRKNAPGVDILLTSNETFMTANDINSIKCKWFRQ